MSQSFIKAQAEVISEVEIEQATREKSPEEQEWEKTANDLQQLLVRNNLALKR